MPKTNMQSGKKVFTYTDEGQERSSFIGNRFRVTYYIACNIVPKNGEVMGTNEQRVNLKVTGAG